jgi:hypothetical protein
VDPLLKKIADERQNLRAAIKTAHEVIRTSQERLGKLDELEKLALQLFSSDEASGASATMELVAIKPEVAALGAIAIAAVAAHKTKKDRILETSLDILSDGRRRQSKELVDELQKRGVEVGGRDPVNNLAAYLSPDERFDSKRSEGGWGLVLRPKKGGPNDVGASKGPVGVNNGAVQRHPVAG